MRASNLIPASKMSFGKKTNRLSRAFNPQGRETSLQDLSLIDQLQQLDDLSKDQISYLDTQQTSQVTIPSLNLKKISSQIRHRDEFQKLRPASDRVAPKKDVNIVISNYKKHQKKNSFHTACVNFQSKAQLQGKVESAFLKLMEMKNSYQMRKNEKKQILINRKSFIRK